MSKKHTYLTVSTGIILAFAFFSISCSKSGSNAPVNPVVPVAQPVTKVDTTQPNYTLIWSDEFNGTSIDNTVWNMETGSLNVNNEDEYYQTANATVANGNLVITAKREQVGNFPYTSARMNTLNKVSAQYGRIEARIKLPVGLGLWPAFWMMGTNLPSVSWPTCGEIDIMEHVNANNTIYGTMHWNSGGHVQYGKTTDIVNPGDYHIYAVDWDKNSIRWYVDNTLYVTADISNGINNTGAFQLPFFIILNLAVGGDFPGQNIDTSVFPASMYVDYVRVYKAS